MATRAMTPLEKSSFESLNAFNKKAGLPLMTKKAYVESIDKRASLHKEVVKGVADLERKYASKGLQFTVPFAGAVPVQAYGWLNGHRFYFRFRYNHATLAVGPYDDDFETWIHEREIERNKKRRQVLHAKRISGERSAEDVQRDLHWIVDEEMPKATDLDYYPHRIMYRGSAEGLDLLDTYKGTLDTASEMVDIFSRCVDSLRYIRKPKQYGFYSQEYLQHLADKKA